MSAHKNFLDELRDPVNKYNRKRNEYRRKKAEVPRKSVMSVMDKNDLMKKMEANYDKLFRLADDE